MKPIILLDIDGTLVDSNGLHAESWHEALAKFDIESDVSALRRLIGMGGDKLLPAVSGIEEDSPRGQEIKHLRSELFLSKYLPRVQPFPGARELVLRIGDLGQTPVVASSANARELTGLLARGKVLDLLPLRTGSDDAAESKPDPDIVQAALERAGARPQDALLLGDTPYDLEAAQRAGVDFVGVCSGGWTRGELAGALAIYRDVADLLIQLDTSPLLRDGRAS